MSTSIDVLPRRHDYPSVESVRSLFEGHLNVALTGAGATMPVTVEALFLKSGHTWWPEQGAIWNGNAGLWLVIHVDNVVVSAVDGSWFEHEEGAYDIAEAIDEWREHLDPATCEAVLAAGHVGYVERRAGAPVLFNLAYGVLAGVMAELTNGVVVSVDGAAPHEWFPMEALDFLERWSVYEAARIDWDRHLAMLRGRDAFTGFLPAK